MIQYPARPSIFGDIYSRHEIETMAKEFQLTNGMVLLRPYRHNDIGCLYEAVRESIVELSLWMPWCHAGYSLEESRTWVESRAEAWAKGIEYDFAITDCNDSILLGGCGLNQIESADRFGGLGYWVRSSRTGTGIASSAALLVAHFGFDELRLNRIEIVVATGNKASQRVAQKIGAVREGVMRNRLVVHDMVYDAVLFSLIPGDLNREVTSAGNT